MPVDPYKTKISIFYYTVEKADYFNPEEATEEIIDEVVHGTEDLVQSYAQEKLHADLRYATIYYRDYKVHLEWQQAPISVPANPLYNMCRLSERFENISLLANTKND